MQRAGEARGRVLRAPVLPPPGALPSNSHGAASPPLLAGPSNGNGRSGAARSASKLGVPW
jgi:hypothetical protein